MPDMLGRDEALGVEKAIGLIRDSLRHIIPPEEAIPLERAHKRVLSRDVVSPEDLPGFDRSSVDGYAVISADTFGSSEGSPAYLNVKHEIPMGEEPGFAIKNSEAAKIPTGGMLPQGADSVVMFENVQGGEDGAIEILRPVSPGENVIRAGEDLKNGETVLKRGRRLRPQDLAVLAGVGITEVFAYKRPVVSVISTGEEVVRASAAIKPGQVRDMNSYNLAGLIMEEGGEPKPLGIVRDDYEDVKGIIKESLNGSSLVLISGGSSVGARDVTEKAIRELGRVVFHNVAMKPGKPTLFGLIDDKIPVFGIPGHPRAVSVCFDVFIRPVLRRLSGLNGFENGFKHRNIVMARLSKAIRSSIGRQEHVSVSLSEVGGELIATPLYGKSGLMTMLVKADATVIVPEGRAGIESGEIIEAKLLY